MLRRVTVFCGSSSGFDKIFVKQAYMLGQTLAARDIGVVYGGANVGLMGSLAQGVLSNKGKIIGVLPGFLKEKEIAHPNLTELILVESMHERKKKMNELADGIIALPGGFGTLEEFFEMLTWAQLGLHKKPVAILNIGEFYTKLVELMQHMVDTGFLKEINKNMLIVSDNIDELLGKMNSYSAPSVGKWISNDVV